MGSALTKKKTNPSMSVTNLTRKILLLGTSNSGKSTLFKSIQSIFSTYEDDNKADISIIRQQVVMGIIELIFQSNRLHKQFNRKGCFIDTNDITIQSHIDTIRRLKDNLFENESKIKSLANSIAFIWNLTAIKTTWDYRVHCKYQIYDNLDYFLNKIHSIMDIEYQMTFMDKLYANINTSGHHMLSYIAKGDSYEVVDVGGMHAERQKWYQYFDRVHCVIFCVSLNDYCKHSIENKHTNAMQESLQLFDEICNFKNFKNTSIVIFFTKRDLFIEHLKYTPLTYCFGNVTESLVSLMFDVYEKEMNIMVSIDVRRLIIKYCYDTLHEYDFGWTDNLINKTLDDCYQKSIQFIMDTFSNVNKSNERYVYTHVLNVLDEHCVMKTMDDVYHTISFQIHPYLHHGGIFRGL